MVAKSELSTRGRTESYRGSLNGVRVANLAFYSALGISLLIHAVAFGSVWQVMGSRPPKTREILSRDVWVGTTVSVVAEQPGHSVPASQQGLVRPEAAIPQPRITKAAAVRVPVQSKPVDHSTAAPTMENEARPTASHRVHVGEGATRGSSTRAELPSKNPSPSPASIDLNQAMIDASNRKDSGAGAFGAVGVDVRERRLPAAITRALPVAIGAQPAWWRHRLGSLGSLKFEVVLDDSGKIQEVQIDDEQKNAWLSGIVRRVGRLLAVGRYALTASTVPGARQRFELKLELDQGSPPSSVTAEPGDAVDMGWEAPTTSTPGKAHIQEAQGRTMRATLRVLPPLQSSSAGRAGATPASE